MTRFTLPAWAFTPELDDEVLVSFLDIPQTSNNWLNWEQLNSWLTPTNQAFNVQHYGLPEVDTENFQLEIAGLVKKPIS
jgi:DMSO/TMAO reductase YedYZ molybdopterin-dependent catalytic subunit